MKREVELSPIKDFPPKHEIICQKLLNSLAPCTLDKSSGVYDGENSHDSLTARNKQFQTSIISRLFRCKVALINHRFVSSDSDLCHFKPKAKTFFCTTSHSDKSALITK